MKQLICLLDYFATFVKSTMKLYLSSNSCEHHQFEEIEVIAFIVFLTHTD